LQFQSNIATISVRRRTTAVRAPRRKFHLDAMGHSNYEFYI